MKKIFYIILGLIGLFLGTLGIFLPILPTTPFLLLALICFAKGSTRLHNWFIKSKIYEKNLKSFVEKNEMPISVKIRVMCLITLLMGVGFFMMFRKSLYIPCLILFIVWIFHIIYFIFRIKTKKKEKIC
ncbi:YbaN family protein [Helcococcus ovis]|uniref:YbaN family protein n=1 Tax=Helcococcus ovis TaxID=72026 RepID=UPI0038B89F5B